MIGQDEREEFETWRDRIEYLARFMDNESVDRIQRIREDRTQVDDGDFNVVLKSTFGRSIHRQQPESVPPEVLGEMIKQHDRK